LAFKITYNTFIHDIDEVNEHVVARETMENTRWQLIHRKFAEWDNPGKLNYEHMLEKMNNALLQVSAKPFNAQVQLE